MTGDGTDSRIDENGRIEILRRVWERLQLEPGDLVRVSVEDGRIVARPRASRSSFADAMRGCLTEESKGEDAPPFESARPKENWLSDLPDE
jgi:antitoxin component of MazEF toxin-antitoxin module